MSSLDPGAATVSPAMLTFTTANWDALQTVTVAGVDDPDMAAEAVLVQLAASGIATRSVNVTVTDPHQQEVVVGASALVHTGAPPGSMKSPPTPLSCHSSSPVVPSILNTQSVCFAFK